jgi:hypothetical protein
VNKIFKIGLFAAAIAAYIPVFGMELAIHKQNSHEKSGKCLQQRLAGDVFPEELSYHILNATDDEGKDILRKTCWSFNRELSMNGPCVDALIANPLFHTKSTNIRYLAFNAGWSSNVPRLKVLMSKMGERDYWYQYGLPGTLAKGFGLDNIVKIKMPAQYDEIAEVAQKSGCSFDSLSGCEWCDELTVACYNKNHQLVQQILVTNTYDKNHLGYALCIAIDRDSSECIKVLSPHIQNADLRSHQDILKVAMKNKKYVAFETLVANNKSGYLNAQCSAVDGQELTIFDWVSLYCQQTGDETCADIYKRLGGKRHKELGLFGLYCSIQ